MQTVEIKNTNIILKGGEYIVNFTNNIGGFGERTMLITNSIKEIKKYQKAGYFIFGSPEIFINGNFYLLTKTLKNKTKNHKNICILNSMYHINKHIENGKKLSYQVYPN